MRLSRLPVCGTIGRYCLVLTVIGICTTFLAAGANTINCSSGTNAISEAAEKSTRQKRIKRLKPADPESSEVMLA